MNIDAINEALANPGSQSKRVAEFFLKGDPSMRGKEYTQLPFDRRMECGTVVETKIDGSKVAWTGIINKDDGTAWVQKSVSSENQPTPKISYFLAQSVLTKPCLNKRGNGYVKYFFDHYECKPVRPAREYSMLPNGIYQQIGQSNELQWRDETVALVALKREDGRVFIQRSGNFKQTQTTYFNMPDDDHRLLDRVFPPTEGWVSVVSQPPAKLDWPNRRVVESDRDKFIAYFNGGADPILFSRER